MGLWFSSLLRSFVWFGLMEDDKKSIQLEEDGLLSRAAHIASAQLQFEEASSTSGYRGRGCTRSSDEVGRPGPSPNSSEQDGSNSDSKDSDEDCESLMNRARHEMFQQDHQRKCFERVTVGNQESANELKEDMVNRCVARTSVLKVCRLMQLGRNLFRRHPGPSVSACEKRCLENRFFPNQRKVFEQKRTKFFCCQYVDNGNELAIAAQDETIRFYSPSGKQRKYNLTKEYRLMGVSWSILDVAMAPNGRALAYGTWKDAVTYCTLGEPTVEAPEGITFHSMDIPNTNNSTAVFSLRFNQDGNEVLAGTSDGTLNIFDVETQRRIVYVEDAHGDDVNAVCYNSDEAVFFSGGDDGLIKAWDRRALSRRGDPMPVGTFAGHRDGVTYIDTRGDGRYILSNCKDQTIKLWDLRHFSSPAAAKATISAVQQQQWDYRWQAPPIKMRKFSKCIEGDTSVMTFRGHCVLHTLVRAKFSPEPTGRRYIYTGCARGEVIVYDILCEKAEQRLPGHIAVVRDCAWHPEVNEIATTSWDGYAALWRWDERKEPVVRQSFSQKMCKLMKKE